MSISVQSHLQVHLYIDDVLSINNPEFDKYLDQMYPAELDNHFCFFPRFHTVDLEGWSTSHFYLRRTGSFQFPHHKLPFLSSNIPSSPVYGVFISRLIRYHRACSSYEYFHLMVRRLSSKLLKQGYLVERLKPSFRKFYGKYRDLIQQYEVSFHKC